MKVKTTWKHVRTHINSEASVYSWQHCAFDSAWLYIKPHTQQNGEKNSVKSPLSLSILRRSLGKLGPSPKEQEKCWDSESSSVFHTKSVGEKERERKRVKGRGIFLVSEYMVQVKDCE